MRRVAQEPLSSFFPFNHWRLAIGNAFGVDNKRSDLDIIMSERASGRLVMAMSAEIEVVYCRRCRPESLDPNCFEFMRLVT